MSEDNSKKHASSATHRGPQHSTTLNRHYVQRPKAMKESAETTEAVAISSFAKCQAENLRRRQELAEKINQERLMAMKERKKQNKRVEVQEAAEMQVVEPVEKSAEIVEKPVENYVENSLQNAVNARLAKTWGVGPRKQPTAQELKDEAIRKAMRSVATMEANEKKERRKKIRRPMTMKRKGRVVLALVSAVAVVAMIGYFVSVNLPNVSVQVTALQSGIDNPYPSYVPRGFNMVTSMAGDGSVSMTFANGDDSFTLTEEKSAWDSKALLNNYVEQNWRGYDTVREQGLTIYISGSNAAWVNGGIKYTIEAKNGVLTNKQIKNIATSL